jgi:hypothetical protein
VKSISILKEFKMYGGCGQSPTSQRTHRALFSGIKSPTFPDLISLTIFGGSLQITGNGGWIGDPEESVRISFILRESIAWMQT